jgi:ketosteroid isomerase-like protein
MAWVISRRDDIEAGAVNAGAWDLITEPEPPGCPLNAARFFEWVEIGRRSEDILVLPPRKMLVDDDSVAVVGFMRCRAIPTGKEYESDFVHVVTLEAGKVTKFQEFFDTYAAREAFPEVA